MAAMILANVLQPFPERREGGGWGMGSGGEGVWGGMGGWVLGGVWGGDSFAFYPTLEVKVKPNRTAWACFKLNQREAVQDIRGRGVRRTSDQAEPSSSEEP